MAKVRITSKRVGVLRLWNDIIAEYYDRGDEPVWKQQEDGTRVARMKQDCADDLVDEFDFMDHADEDTDIPTDLAELPSEGDVAGLDADNSDDE